MGALFVRIVAARALAVCTAARLGVAFGALSVRNGGRFLGGGFFGSAGDDVVEFVEVFGFGGDVGDVGDNFDGVVHGGVSVT